MKKTVLLLFSLLFVLLLVSCEASQPPVELPETDAYSDSANLDQFLDQPGTLEKGTYSNGILSFKAPKDYQLTRAESVDILTAVPLNGDSVNISVSEAPADFSSITEETVTEQFTSVFGEKTAISGFSAYTIGSASAIRFHSDLETLQQVSAEEDGTKTQDVSVRISMEQVLVLAGDKLVTLSFSDYSGSASADFAAAIDSISVN